VLQQQLVPIEQILILGGGLGRSPAWAHQQALNFRFTWAVHAAKLHCQWTQAIEANLPAIRGLSDPALSKGQVLAGKILDKESHL